VKTQRFVVLMAFAFAARTALAATYYFDVNDTAAGSGISNGGNYNWTGAYWTTANDGITATIAPGWGSPGNEVNFVATGDADTNSFTITLPGGGAQTWVQTLTVNSGNPDIAVNGGNFVLGATSTWTIPSGRTLKVTGNGSGSWGAFNMNTCSLTLSGDGNSEFAAMGNSGGGTLVKNGTGSLTLTVADSLLYGGATTINGGKIVANAGNDTYHNIRGSLNLAAGELAAIGTRQTSFGHFFFSNSVQQVVVSGTSRSIISCNLHMSGTHTFDVASTGDGGGIDLLITGYLGNQEGTAWGFITKTGVGTMAYSNATPANSVGSLTISAGKVLLIDSSPSFPNGGLINNSTAEARIGAGKSVTIGYVISGSGTFTKSGTGLLVLTTNNTFSGTTTISGGTLQLGDGSSKYGSLAGNIVNNSCLVLANPNDQSYSGSISGSGTLIKTCTSTQTLTSLCTYTGDTIISNGTLKVVLYASYDNPVAGAARWFDASNLGLTNGEAITQWNDLSGNNAHAVNGTGLRLPTYTTNAVNGLGAVTCTGNFGNDTGQYLLFARDSSIWTVFSVFKGGSFLLTDSGSVYHFHRPSNNNAASPLWDSVYASDNIKNGTTYVNGVAVNGTTYAMPTVLNNGFNLVEVLTIGNVTADGFNRDRVYHSGNQSHGEVLIYDRVLTENERLQNEAYLSRKWFGQSGLSSNTTVYINTGGLLEISASTQTVRRLYLDGIQQHRGTYGADGSGARYTNDNFFAGSGVLNVLRGPPGTVIKLR
jgi:fibronectin-binding autotransporter adhesin